eukprot:3330474-Heterocapsa_arctica.AAC.1
MLQRTPSLVLQKSGVSGGLAGPLSLSRSPVGTGPKTVIYHSRSMTAYAYGFLIPSMPGRSPRVHAPLRSRAPVNKYGRNVGTSR